MSARVLVCGGRDYANVARVYLVLGLIHDERCVTAIIHGAATGADSLAARWADEMGVECIACPADWATNGRAAGPIRNAEMLTHSPDIVVAFPGGRGTADLIRRAHSAGIYVIDGTA